MFTPASLKAQRAQRKKSPPKTAVTGVIDFNKHTAGAASSPQLPLRALRLGVQINLYYFKTSKMQRDVHTRFAQGAKSAKEEVPAEVGGDWGY